MLQKIDLKDIVDISKEAGKSVMEIYKRDFKIDYKSDLSPVTEADLMANEIIVTSLEKRFPEIPILSEESGEIPFEERKDWDFYWCIDPIDGTREFIKKNGEFTINIALIRKRKPVLGVVYAPAINDIYYAKEGEGAFKNGKKIYRKWRTKKGEKPYFVVSRSNLSKKTREFINSFQNIEEEKLEKKGSSLKLCMVAEGVVDIYPRLSDTMEWDTAAADAIVRESGKMSYQYETNIPLIYNKRELLNPWFIVK